MEEPSDGEPAWEPVPQAEFEADLVGLAPNDLRQKYRKEASSHRNMKSRCADGAFELDPMWEDFRSFLRDVGPVTSADATLDRINPENRRYGPQLVRWADKRTQTANRTSTRWLHFDGEEMTWADFARRVNKPYDTVYAALRRGDTPEEIAGPRARAKAFPGTSWRHPVPELEASAAKEFEAWKRKLNKAHRHYAFIDVFFFLSA